MKKDEIPEPYKSDNEKAKLSPTQVFWLVIFSIILAAIYAYVNIM
ncbi:MAG TPA: hypothetical protein VJ939_01550 [Bacteroidales bacterium]|nr:hypothetical protein [Bacteroidales bacterium]